MSSIKDNNYIQISGWMINELNLKGNELLVYGLIHGFSQDGRSVYSGGLSYISSWLNCTENTVISALKSLLKKDLIKKEVRNQKGSVKYVEYYTVKSRNPNISTTSKNEVVNHKRQNLENQKSNTVKNALKTFFQKKLKKDSIKKSRNPNIFTTSKNEVVNHDRKICSGTTSKFAVATTSNFEDNINSINSIKISSPEKIKKIIKEIVGDDSFVTDTFIKQLLKKVGKYENFNLEKYLSNVWKICQKRNPENLIAYYTTCILNNITISDFLVKAEKQNRAEKEQLFTCPVCKTEHNVFKACPNCCLTPFDRNNDELLEIKIKENALPEDIRNKLNSELLKISQKYLFDSSPNKFAKRKQETRDLYVKYGLVTNVVRGNENV